MADANEQLSDELRDLADKMGQTGGAAADVIKSLMQLASVQKKDAALKEEIAKAQARQKEGYDKIEQGLKKLGSSATQVMMGFSSVTASIYNSDKAFTAVIPVIDLMANVTKSFVEALGLAASGITILGTGTGKVSEAIAKFVTTGIDIATAAVKQQIESTQKLFDNFDHLSKAGVTYGGSIDKLARSAAEGGISIDTFTKITSKNADAMNTIGGSVEAGAAKVVKFGKKLADQDNVLLATYGSYENLNSAIAEYAAQQTKYGVSGAQLNKDMEGSARSYLYQQKELANLTGKNVDQLKKEADERSKSAAYQIALGKMTAEERQNSEYAIAQISAKYGKEAAQYAMEYVSTGGEVSSRTGKTFEAMAGPVASSVADMVKDLKQNNDAFKESTNNTITANSKTIDAWAKSNETLAKIDQAGYDNATIKMMTGVTSAVLASMNAQESASKVAKDIAKDQKDADKDAATMYASAIKSLEGFKTQMDALTITHLPQVADQMKLAYYAAEKLADGLNAVNDTIAFMQGKMSAEEYKKSVETRINSSGKDVSALEAERSNILQYGNRKTLSEERVKELDIIEAKIAELKNRQDGAPKYSNGGIASGPDTGHMATLHGTEAVVPLPDGRTIPVTMDMSDLTKSLGELADLARQQRDIQEKLLNNSY